MDRLTVEQQFYARVSERINTSEAPGSDQCLCCGMAIIENTDQDFLFCQYCRDTRCDAVPGNCDSWCDYPPCEDHYLNPYSYRNGGELMTGCNTSVRYRQ